ncbi:imidazolonepropionase [Dongshaea marina]|uniref:imidazolonepropionase n=1 Tax=Dongshaea marina TaxID=2047966 RepID=UPI001900AAD2
MEPAPIPYGLMEDCAIGIYQGKINAILPMSEFEATRYTGKLCDAEGRLITPGLIDCHTHLVFAGSRATEFEQRLQGLSYTQIIEQGGGIHSTVRATRQASEQELYELALPRLQHLMNQGVTTLEIKSGYGLTEPDELKMLRVARRLAEENPIRISTSLLAAHVVPLEYSSQPQHYVDWICDELIPVVAEMELADSLDLFCESIAFDAEQTRQLFAAAQIEGLALKGHMEQLSNLGGSRIAAEFQALSVDHLEFLSEQDISALAASGTVATLLPIASYFLQQQQKPPVEALRRAKIPIAVASDFNPGTAPILSLRMAMNIGCINYGLTPEEALTGVTYNAAKALGLEHLTGSLSPNLAADLVIWECEHPAELSYQIGPDLVYKRIFGGVESHD